jgi:hypothetical protein
MAGDHSRGSRSGLGIVALLILMLGALGLVFFRTASERARVAIFVLLFLGAAGLTIAVVREKGEARGAGESAATDITLRPEGAMSFADDAKGTFTVAWRKLSLHYDGRDLEYDAEFSTSFPGCDSCRAQILVWVGTTTYQDCAFDGSANTGFASRRGRLSVPKSATLGAATPIYLVAALDKNCGGAQAGHSHTGQQTVGTIWPNP